MGEFTQLHRPLFGFEQREKRRGSEREKLGKSEL